MFADCSRAMRRTFGGGVGWVVGGTGVGVGGIGVRVGGTSVGVGGIAVGVGCTGVGVAAGRQLATTISKPIRSKVTFFISSLLSYSSLILLFG